MIKVICVGRLKEEYLKSAISEYKKRLSKYHKLEIIEVEDSKVDDKTIALNEEKARIMKHFIPKAYIITLEVDGKQLTSPELANLIDKTFITNSDIIFIIGGSYGIHQDIIDMSNFHLSFSRLTFPHQLFRVLLLEQLFRSFKILNNEKYHK